MKERNGGLKNESSKTKRIGDFREEKGGIRQRRKAHRAKLFLSFFGVCREVKLYRMLVREVGELLRSMDSPSISNPNENRSESLPAWLLVVVL